MRYEKLRVFTEKVGNSSHIYVRQSANFLLRVKTFRGDASCPTKIDVRYKSILQQITQRGQIKKILGL
jgi:hypothetical protein